MNFLGLLAGVPEAIGKYFIERNAQKSQERLRKMELEDAIHVRRVELVKEGLHADASWELEQIRSSGWKDEYVLIVLSIPLVMCFIPGLDGVVSRGFAALALTPNWYQWMIPVVFCACFGIRLWRRQQSDT